jgi:hypothetical protein
MNLPIKIKDKKPWVSLSSYSSLLIDDINFSNYEISPSDPSLEGYFGRKHVDNLVEAIGTEISTDTTFYEDTLEVLFFNIESVIDKLTDYVYLTNPVSIVDSIQLDILLENAVNKASIDLPNLWGDSLIKNTLTGNMSRSFLDYELRYDTREGSSQCRVLFRYLPEGTERSVLIDFKVSGTPEDTNPKTSSLSTWGSEFTESMKEAVAKSWRINYDWKEDNYQRELYRSIMSKRGGMTIDEFYVKSYNLVRYSGKINPKYVEELTGFSGIDPKYFGTYSFNIISRLSDNTYNATTINPGFTNQTQGWNRVSHYSSVTESSDLSPTVEFDVVDTDIEFDAQLHVDKSYNKFSQVNRVPPGMYELKLSLQTNVDRNFRIFIGEVVTSFSLLASDAPKVITLTDSALGGIDLSSIPDGIIEYGFEIEEVTNPSDSSVALTKVDYCRINKL